jgi:hypothetical protein
MVGASLGPQISGVVEPGAHAAQIEEAGDSSFADGERHGEAECLGGVAAAEMARRPDESTKDTPVRSSTDRSVSTSALYRVQSERSVRPATWRLGNVTGCEHP